MANKYKNVSFNQLALINDFKDSVTFIAKKHGVSRARALQLFDELFPAVDAASLSRIVCIDEIKYKGYLDSPYATVLMDFETQQPIDIIGSRTKDYLGNYFSLMPSEEKDKVKYIVSDMFEGFKRVALRHFPNANHIVDRFHVVQLLSREVNRIRSAVMKCYFKDEIEYKFMKSHWKLFLISKKKIPDRFYKPKGLNAEIHYDDMIFRCLHLDERLLIAWGCYQELLNIPWGFETYKASIEKLERIINQLTSSNIEELAAVGQTYKQFKTSILMGISKNQLNFKLTNGRMECLNNHIKTITKDAYGFLNFSRFRRRSLVILRNRKSRS